MKVLGKSWRTVRAAFVPKECTPTCPTGDLQQAGNELIMKIAQKANIPLLLTLDSHFVKDEQKVVQDLALQNGRDSDFALRFSTSYYMMNTDEAWSNWKNLHPGLEGEKAFCEAVANNAVLASRCEPIKMEKKFRLPDITIPPDIRSASKNEEDAQTQYVLSLIERYGRMIYDSDYIQRLKLEIKVIRDNGKINLLPYFITLHDICVVARNLNIPIGPGRGSAGGCLLAYLLGITQKDPIKYDLSFERFLSQGRINRGKLPDIDMDFGDTNTLAKALKDIYGDKIVRICTTGTNKVKGAIKDVCRVVMDTQNNPDAKMLVEAVCKTISDIPQGTEDMVKWLDGYDSEDGHVEGEKERNSFLASFFLDRPEIEKLVKQLLGIPRSIGRHAAAYCIADEPIHQLIPICVVKEEVCTQFTMEPVEALGLIKFDMLGLNTLNDIQGCINLIKDRHGVVIDMYKIDENDKEVYQDFCKGRTETVFQFNGTVPTKICNQIKPNNLQELAMITAACRPGCMYAELEVDGKVHKLIDLWVQRRNGQLPTRFFHPSLETVLGETNGIFIFQEQINKMFVQCCGYSPEEADEIREIIGKKKRDKMNEILPDIKARLFERGWNKTQTDAIISLCISSSSYVFNKSHSVTYGYIGYVCAWLKRHYPLEWWTAILRNGTRDDLSENAKHFKDYLSLPDVNKSDLDFYIIDDEKKKIVYPLSMIKGVKNAAGSIMPFKPFQSFQDFLDKVPKRIVNKRVVNAMIWAGAFDSMPEAEGEKFWQKRNSLYKFYHKFRKEPEPEVINKVDIMKRETEAMSVGDPDIYSLYLERHPATDAIPIEACIKLDHDKKTKTIGLIKEVKVIKTKKGDDMCFVDLVNSEYQISVTMFPKMYESHKENLKAGAVMQVLGKINVYNERKSIVADFCTFYDLELM